VVAARAEFINSGYRLAVRWFERLFSKRVKSPQPKRIADLDEPGELVELVGEVEALALLHDPVDHEPAVILHYHAGPTSHLRSLLNVEAPFADTGGSLEVHQATNFVLRDASGAALIEVDPGVDVGAAHQRMLGLYNALINVDIDLIAPGDRVRIQGRVRSGVAQGSPHRREDWSAVVRMESVEIEAARSTGS